VSAGVIGRNECVIQIGRVEGVLVNQIYGRAMSEKIYAEPVGVQSSKKRSVSPRKPLL
jgi:hypothetical protein